MTDDRTKLRVLITCVGSTAKKDPRRANRKPSHREQVVARLTFERWNGQILLGIEPGTHFRKWRDGNEITSHAGTTASAIPPIAHTEALEADLRRAGQQIRRRYAFECPQCHMPLEAQEEQLVEKMGRTLLDLRTAGQVPTDETHRAASITMDSARRMLTRN